MCPFSAVVCLFFKTSSLFSPRPVLTGPHVAYVGSRVTFWCRAPGSPLPVTYRLLRGGTVPVGADAVSAGNRSVAFPLKVAAASGGSYHCRAAAGGATGVSEGLQLSVVTPPSNTRVLSEPFPPVAYEGSRFALSCVAARGSHLSYTWFFNRTELSSGSSFAHAGGNRLVVEKVTAKHAGYYSCLAWSTVQNTSRFSSSSEVLVTVKVYASKPSVSFSVSKEGDDYHGRVTCQSSKGTPPVNFSLTLDGREVGRVTATDSLSARFPVAVVPGRDLGRARCRVTNEVQDLSSEPLALAVVPVGGGAAVAVDYLYATDSRLAAARLRCSVGRGTFPRVSWLLNGSALPSETLADSPTQHHYALADSGRTLFVTSLGPEESGFYRCRVRDSYHDSGPWVESKAVLLQATDKGPHSPPAAASLTEDQPKVSMTTTRTITITFCCLFLLALALGFGYTHKLYLQAHGHGA